MSFGSNDINQITPFWLTMIVLGALLGFATLIKGMIAGDGVNSLLGLAVMLMPTYYLSKIFIVRTAK